jgi:hypothetical protein
MKLWHDDIRPAPEGWVWARTNTEAKMHLRTGYVEEISMDHDLGAQGLPPVVTDQMTPEEFREYMTIRGTGEETGLGLAQWMALQGCIPEKITIHSWNPTGAARMAAVLYEASGTMPLIEPFRLP